MKSHVLLLGRVLEDLSIRCCTSTTHDLKTVVSRIEDEGVSFLTITLPTFGKDFERGLDRGKVDSTLFLSFKKRGSLPAFLQGLTSLVFSKEDGVLLGNPSLEAIQGVRQVSYLFSKLEYECSEERTYKAFKAFVECDNEVGTRTQSQNKLNVHLHNELTRMGMLVFGDVLTEVDRKVYYGEIVPKHGPGATADRITANAKYDNRLWTTRLEELFPAGDYLYPSWSHFCEDEPGPTWLEPEAEIPARVVSVPKTLKTPRVIAIEPAYNQYVQQAIKEPLVEGIEKDDFLNDIVGFVDQEMNRTMACHGSFHLDLATLDLSEASDRVSSQHVRALLAKTPTLRDGVFACRSPKADIPGHGIKTLAKFASMGSALTFPLEAMVFATVIFLGIEKELRTPLTRKSIKEFRGKVRVYGDDILVPVEYVRSVVLALESYGFKVNESKSFWTGRFRESCGGEYYDGVDVGVVKLRRDLPTQRKHVRELESTVAFRNLMYYRGYWATAAYLDEYLRRIIPFPTVHPNSPGMGRHTFLEYEIQRECPHLQRPLVKAAVIASKAPYSDVSGVGALLKYFLKRGDEPFADKKHLERAGRPDALNINIRWVTPY